MPISLCLRNPALAQALCRTLWLPPLFGCSSVPPEHRILQMLLASNYSFFSLLHHGETELLPVIRGTEELPAAASKPFSKSHDLQSETHWAGSRNWAWPKSRQKYQQMRASWPAALPTQEYCLLLVLSFVLSRSHLTKRMGSLSLKSCSAILARRCEVARHFNNIARCQALTFTEAHLAY